MLRDFHTAVTGLLIVVLALLVPACRTDSDSQTLRPRQLRDVPANRLGFNFQADVEPPANLPSEDAKSAPAIQQDFDSRRQQDALLRTVMSPDGQRGLALYGTADEPTTTFRIDLYSADGTFLRNVTPPTLAVVFQDSVTWSADSSMIAFVGRKSAEAQASPTPLDLQPEPVLPSASPVPTATIGPSFAPLQVFNTEQVYVCNRDGDELRPLTRRDGLIYFGLTWAPDGHALAALACKENEWDAREKELKTPAGRPRLIMTDGTERLLDDQLAEAPIIWSPDSSKVATAFDVNIGIYDAANKAPTQARIALREQLLTASTSYDERSAGKTKPDDQNNKNAPAASVIGGLPVSFNPVVRLEWPTPDKLYIETAYVSLRSELIKTFARWHLITLSPQAAVLRR
ncbi:MAG TPA: hypothetical protein VK557_06690 [Pyrinomonadaceae bacterium]|nr:hypothetical protein [Pyrinomonadaceae bacterium]